MRHRIFSLLLAIIVWGCHNDKGRNEEKAASEIEANQRFSLVREQIATLQLSKPDSAVSLLNRFAADPKNRAFPNVLIRCYVGQCQTHCQYKKAFNQAEKYVDSAFLLASKNPKLLYKAHYVQGICALNQEQFREAEKSLLQSAASLPADADTMFIATLYNTIANLYYIRENYEKALEYYQLILDISLKRSASAMDALAFINAYCYASAAKKEKDAAHYLSTAKTIASKLNDSGLNALLYYNIAAFYLDRKQYDSAAYNNKISMNFMHGVQSQMNRPEKVHIQLMDIYLASQNTAGLDQLSALALKTIDTATLEIKDKLILNKTLYIIEKGKGNKNAALSYLEQANRLSSSLAEAAISDQLLQFERQKQQFASDQRLNKKNQELKIQKFYNLILSLMALLVSLLGILGYFRWKKRKELIRKETELLLLRKEVENKNQLLAERNRIAQEMHDDLGSTLTSTMIAVEMVNMNPGSTEGLKTINDNAHKLWQQINEVIWSLNMRNDSLQKLSNHLISYAKEFIQQTKLQFQFEESIETGNLEISGEKRRKIFLIVKELLNNVVRHAEAGKVLLGVEEKNGLLRICVEDDGVGFDPERGNNDGREHYGLSNLRKQITELEGRLEISATKGTRVCFSIKID